jgi:hypothetical protein
MRIDRQNETTEGSESETESREREAKRVAFIDSARSAALFPSLYR